VTGHVSGCCLISEMVKPPAEGSSREEFNVSAKQA